MRCTDALSRFLQSVDMDVFLARKTANGMVSTLKVLKNDRDFLLLWALAEKLSEEIKEVISDVVTFPLRSLNNPENEFIQGALLKKKLQMSR